MAYQRNSSKNGISPVKFTLTPSSERSPRKTEPPVQPSPTSGHFARHINSTTPALSSTCASVDSDSDYQWAEGSTYDDAGDASMSTPSALNPPSRPLSRTSTMSGVSTTATKDGVEGNRLHRFHDPQGYAKWISLTSPGNQSPLHTPPVTGPPLEEDSMMADDELDSVRAVDDEDVLEVAAEVASKAIIDEESPNTHANDTNNSGNSRESLYKFDEKPPSGSSHHQQLLFHQQQQLQEADSASSFVPTPPNHPGAPPVTLSEKIRLLRTGSVSRKHAGDAEASV